MMIPPDQWSTKSVRKDVTSSEEVSKKDPYKPVEPIPDEGKQKSNFKEYLKQSAKTKKDKQATATSETDTEEKSSIFAIAAKKSAVNKPPIEGQQNIANKAIGPHTDVGEEEAILAQKRAKEKVDDKSVNPNASDQKQHGDLADMSQGMGLAQQTAPVEIHTVAKTAAPPPSTHIHETLAKLIEQLQATLQIVKTHESTQVSIRLNEPPIFRGATVVVQEDAQAKGQIVITFGNIQTQAAENLLSNRQNQELLQAQLLDKGYKVNQITIDHRVENEASQSKHDRNREQEDEEL